MKIRDISHHDTMPNLSGYDGVLIKATEGVGYVDPALDTNVAAAKAAGKPWGLYHYLSFQSDVAGQVAAFKAQLDRLTGWTLRPALDVELDDRINQTLPADISARLQAFADAVPGLMLYANPDMLGHLDAAVAGKLPLWQAEYNPSPRDVAGYTRIGWQYRGDPDESTFTDAVLLDGNTSASAQAPAPQPAAPVDDGSRPAPDYPLAGDSYFGPRSGPSTSISGYYSHREDLRRWQQRMADRGWAITPDGLYGDQTGTVAEKFQAEKGLRVDGLIGPATWAAAWTAPITK